MTIEWYVYTDVNRPSSQIPSFEINIRKIYNHKFINLKYERKFEGQLNVSNNIYMSLEMQD